jgi:putative cardiolipin synthase
LLYDHPAKVTADPADRSAHLAPQLAPLVHGTASELLLVSAYFVPGEAGVEWLRAMRARGVRVRVVTNSLAASDVAAVHAGHRRYRRALLEAGVELYETKPGARVDEHATRAYAGLRGSSRAALHAKTFVFDRRALFVGSLNLDPRSLQLNTEIGVLFESAELAGGFLDAVDALLPGHAYRVELVPPGPGNDGRAGIQWRSREQGRELRYDSEPQASLWRRLGVWFLSLLPIESQL